MVIEQIELLKKAVELAESTNYDIMVVIDNKYVSSDYSFSMGKMDNVYVAHIFQDVDQNVVIGKEEIEDYLIDNYNEDIHGNLFNKYAIPYVIINVAGLKNETN